MGKATFEEAARFGFIKHVKEFCHVLPTFDAQPKGFQVSKRIDSRVEEMEHRLEGSFVVQ